MSTRVVFLTTILTHYRISFHQRVREMLSEAGIDYHLVFGQPNSDEAAKGDTASLPWASPIRNRYFAAGRLTWQPALRHFSGAGLIILGQENKLLINYLMQLTPRGFRPAIALFGHGRNFQARYPSSLSERWKRWWARRCDWWFGYTEETRRYIAEIGFLPERITVCNNAIDTKELSADLDLISRVAVDKTRAELGLESDNVCIYIGGLYAAKRLDFLIEAAIQVRSLLPDFELVIVGGGPLGQHVHRLAEPHPWIKITGPKFGLEKAALMSLAKLFLIPGAIGLAILDAFVAGLPVVTTSYPYHGPEIAYLENGVTGLKVSDWEDVSAYSKAVAFLLQDEPRRSSMVERARLAASSYSIDAMAQRFADGVLSALHEARK